MTRSLGYGGASMGELPAQVALHHGDETTVRLPSLAGAGYRWQATVDDSAIAEVTTRFAEAEKDDTGNVSFSPYELLTIRARGPGRTRVRCRQQRGWETETAPAAEYTLEVEVVPASNHEPTTREGNE